MDIRSFFGRAPDIKKRGRADAAEGMPDTSDAANEKPASPPAEQKKRARSRVVLEDDASSGQAPCPSAEPVASPVAARQHSGLSPDKAPARADAPKSSGAGGSSPACGNATVPAAAPPAACTPQTKRNAQAAPVPRAEPDAGEGEDPSSADLTPSPLLTKLDGKGDSATGPKSKGVLENMKAIYDNAKKFKLDATALDWKKDEPVPYAFLVAAFDECAQTTKRIQITTTMCTMLRTVLETTPEDLLPCIYLSLNKLGPSYEGLELGLGDALLLKAVAETCGRQPKQLKMQLEAEGDLGAIAMASRATQRLMLKPSKLTVRKVFKTFNDIARAAGKDSQMRKCGIVKHMLVAAENTEAQYVIRSLQGKLRVGLAEQTVLTALAHAITLSPPPASGVKALNLGKLGPEELHARLAHADEVIKDVYSQMPNYDVILRALLEGPVSALPSRAHLTAGVPVKPMLAKPTKGIQEVLDRFGKGTFTCEFKYDGERAQVHRLEDGTCRIFSRNMEDMTGKYPDLIERLPPAVLPETKSFIVDCEVVAFEPETGKLMTFQTLSTRARKNVTTDNVTVQVKLFAFDLLYLNGEPLIKQPLKRRRALLRSSFAETQGIFSFATSKDSDNAEEIADFLQEAVVGSCEGLMVKTLDENATYEPSKRSLNWLKVKKDYMDGLVDSLDLVPIGAYYGKGKRTGVFGAFLLACFDEDREEYQSICKIGTGFSEEDLKAHAEFFREGGKDRTLDGPRKYYRYPANPNLVPDVFIEPCTVWEVRAADLSISPQHMAAVGEVDESKGIALRFPRFLRRREDKVPEDCTTAKQVAQMYHDQFNAARKLAAGKDVEEEDDQVDDDELEDADDD